MFNATQIDKDPRLVIIGATQKGKTTLASYLLRYYVKNFRIVIIDTKNDYLDVPILKLTDFKTRSFVRRVNQIENFGDEGRDIGFVSEVIAGLLLNYQRTILYIEEVPLAIPKHAELYRSFPNIATTLCQGASTYNGIIVVGQAIADINSTFFKQSSNVYVFHVKPLERDLVEQSVGFKIDWDSMADYEFWSMKNNRIYNKIPKRNSSGIIEEEEK